MFKKFILCGILLGGCSQAQPENINLPDNEAKYLTKDELVQSQKDMEIIANAFINSQIEIRLLKQEIIRLNNELAKYKPKPLPKNPPINL